MRTQQQVTRRPVRRYNGPALKAGDQNLARYIGPRFDPQGMSDPQPSDLARTLAGRRPDGPVLRSPGQTEGADLEGDGGDEMVLRTGENPKGWSSPEPIGGSGKGVPLDGAVPFSGAHQHYLDLLRQPPEESRGKSALYGAAMGGGNAAQSGSLGYTFGAAGGGALMGLLNKKLFGEAKKDRELSRVGHEIAVEDAAKKQQREDEKAVNEGELTKAQTEYWKARPKLDQDKANETSLGRRRTQLLGQIRTQGHYKRGENPQLDAQLDDAEVSVSDFDKASDSFTWHESGGQAFKMNKKGETLGVAVGDKPVVDASKVPDPTTGLTPVQAAQVKQHELDRVSREKIAGEYAKLQGQRNSLSASEFGLRQQQFKAHYPGFGKAPLKLSELEAAQRAEDSRAQRLGTQPRDLRKQAVEQGYAVDEEN